MRLLAFWLLALTFVSCLSVGQTPPSAVPPPQTDLTQADAKPTPQPTDGMAEFRDLHYKKAAPLLKEQLAKEPDNAPVAAHLLTSYVRIGHLAEADALAAELEQKFPTSSDAISARGDLAFFRGDMAKTQSLYLQALKTNEKTARAYYGLFRLYRAASNYRTARLRLLRAYEIDPDDREIAEAWYALLPPEKRRLISEKNRPLTGDEELARDYFTALNREINGRRLFQMDTPPEPATVKLGPLGDPYHVNGLGIQVVLNGSKPLHLLFDTGASGILISEKAAGRVGVKMVGNSEVSGFGDGGTKIIHGAIADTCEIGPLKYKNCLLQAMEGKRVGDEDGLFGADVLRHFVITIDFQKRELQLRPQPSRPPLEIGYDRTPSEDEKGFTAVLQFGHHLMVTTTVNGKETGLFLLDTGTTVTIIDNGFAKEVTKTSYNEHLSLKGLSGTEKNVFEAGRADLTFSRFRQQNVGMMAADLNHLDARPGPVRMSGVLGLHLLGLFRLTIDYRNGLVKFDLVK